MGRASGERAEKVDVDRQASQMLAEDAPDLGQIDLRMKWKLCIEIH